MDDFYQISQGIWSKYQYFGQIFKVFGEILQKIAFKFVKDFGQNY